jgi:hypothetical protein
MPVYRYEGGLYHFGRLRRAKPDKHKKTRHRKVSGFLIARRSFESLLSEATEEQLKADRREVFLCLNHPQPGS